MFEKISYKKDNLLFYLLVGGGLILVAQGEVEGAKEAAAGGFESGYETLTTEVIFSTMNPPISYPAP